MTLTFSICDWKPTTKSENLLTEGLSETLDHTHTLGLPFLACFQWKLVEFLVTFPSYSCCLQIYSLRRLRSFVVSCKFMLCYVTRSTTHAPLTLSVLLIDKRMTARSITGQKEAGKVTNYISVPIRDICRCPVSQFSLPTGLWTSVWL